jgi:dipeptide/tripeptide permease
MEFLDKLVSNPLFVAVAIGLFAFLIYFLIKKLIKLVLVILIALGLFLAYVHFTGGDVKETLTEGKDKASELLDSLKN